MSVVCSVQSKTPTDDATQRITVPRLESAGDCLIRICLAAVRTIAVSVQHIDAGMSRQGLPVDELQALVNESDLIDKFGVELIMSPARWKTSSSTPEMRSSSRLSKQ
ncbi:hypothetical protein CQZ93_25495 [Ochrobactrum vermis]|nr:hypothetical protein CQZ93_25495 [Ochrobactrum vermis]